MSNEKKQIKQVGPLLGVCALVILIVGSLLATNPVKALNPTSPIPTPTGQATSEPTAEPTVEQPPAAVVLSINGPGFVIVGETVHLSVEARGVTGQGLYGAQLAINFDPILLSVSNMQVNPDFSYILEGSADNALGQIKMMASRQGPAAGLTGDVTLFSFDVTALSGNMAQLSFENVQLGDPQAQPVTFTSEDFTLFINNQVPATPVDESPTPTEQPTLTPTYEPTSQPTDEPALPTDEPTLIPIPTYEPTSQPTDESSLPTDEPALPTDEPTLIPIPTYEPTSEPTDEPTLPTDEPTLIPIPTYDSSTDQATATPTPQPTAQLTDQPTPTPSPTGQVNTTPTGESTPQPLDQPTFSSTDEPISQLTAEQPGHTVVLGQIILAGRDNDDWSEGTITLDDTGQNVTSDVNGYFALSDVVAGAFASITADAPGYLPAVCTTLTVSAPETALAAINLLSGDINDDNTVDIADATAIGVSFGQTGPDLPPDINRNESADMFDLGLVSANFGQGAQAWRCLTPSASLLGAE